MYVGYSYPVSVSTFMYLMCTVPVSRGKCKTMYNSFPWTLTCETLLMKPQMKIFILSTLRFQPIVVTLFTWFTY